LSIPNIKSIFEYEDSTQLILIKIGKSVGISHNELFKWLKNTTPE